MEMDCPFSTTMHQQSRQSYSCAISKAEKLPKLLYHGGFWPGTYGLNLVRVCVQTTGFNNVP